jgi:outer membrane immunogenic protein
MRTLAASALFFFTAIGNAFAGDSGVRDWSGPYIGADVGYAWGETGNTWRSPAAGYDDWQPDGNISYGSAIGGGHAGYLTQYGQLVIGAEIDISATALTGNDSQFAGEVNSLEINYLGTVRGRLGYAFATSLVYVTGGFAYSDYVKKRQYCRLVQERQSHGLDDRRRIRIRPDRQLERSR